MIGLVSAAIDLAGIKMKSPVVLSSGTSNFGRELSEYWDLSQIGGICSKGLTLAGSSGNSGTRIWETPSGLLNSIGLENPGVRGFIDNELAQMRTLGTAVIVNLGGHSIDDYVKGAEMLDSEEYDILELNISCPNVREGGMAFGICPESAAQAVRAVRAVCTHKMSVKLTPNAPDIVEVARACEAEGADCISMVNTYLGMAIDVERRKPVFDNVYAGLSGPAIRPIAVRMTHQVAHAVKIPIMAGGGISKARDAIEFIMAGATAVQVGTASLVNPYSGIDIADGIVRFMADHKIADLSEIRGIV